MKHLLFCCLACLFLACGTGKPPAKASAPEVSFARDIRPLLDASCVSCHSAASPGGGYSVESHADLLAPGSDSTPNLVAGQPDSSLLYLYVKEGNHPAGAGLSPAQVELLRRWIVSGARND